jgi:hypothetical protein
LFLQGNDEHKFGAKKFELALISQRLPIKPLGHKHGKPALIFYYEQLNSDIVIF